MEELYHHHNVEKEVKDGHKIFWKRVFADSEKTPELGLHPDAFELKALGYRAKNDTGYMGSPVLKSFHAMFISSSTVCGSIEQKS